MTRNPKIFYAETEEEMNAHPTSDLINFDQCYIKANGKMVSAWLYLDGWSKYEVYNV